MNQTAECPQTLLKFPFIPPSLYISSDAPEAFHSEGKGPETYESHRMEESDGSLSPEPQTLMEGEGTPLGSHESTEIDEELQELTEWVRTNRMAHPRRVRQFPEIELDRMLMDSLPWYRSDEMWPTRTVRGDVCDASEFGRKDRQDAGCSLVLISWIKML